MEQEERSLSEDQPAVSLKRSSRQKPVYMQVVGQIRQSIKRGELAPGDRLLPERELTEKLGVSRTSVRQALAVLDGMGIIEITPRDGAHIRQRSLEDVVEPLTQALYQERGQVGHLFEVRQIIEAQAACLAALRRDEADLKRLQALNRQFAADLDSRDVAFEANRRFHFAIVEAAKNPVLTDLMTKILTATMEVYVSARQRSLLNSDNRLQYVTEHERIIKAIAQQDQNLASDLLTQHIAAARHRVEMVIGEE